MVGQRFVSLMENHPWFDLVVIAASPRSVGKTYEEAVGPRWAIDTPMPDFAKNIVIRDASDVAGIVKDVDFVFSAVDMNKDEILALEEAYAKAECPVVSNNSANRWTPDVPMVIPEINPEHLEVIPFQKSALARLTDLLQSSQTAPFRAMFRLSIPFAPSSELKKFLSAPTKPYPAPEKRSKPGRRCWTT